MGFREPSTNSTVQDPLLQTACRALTIWVQGSFALQLPVLESWPVSAPCLQCKVIGQGGNFPTGLVVVGCGRALISVLPQTVALMSGSKKSPSPVGWLGWDGKVLLAWARRSAGPKALLHFCFPFYLSPFPFPLRPSPFPSLMEHCLLPPSVLALPGQTQCQSSS